MDDLTHLCAIYIVFHEPEKDASWLSLHAWKKLRRGECEKLLNLYLQHHTADEGLFKVDWLLKNEYIISAYLHSLCARKLPLTTAEEKWILSCGVKGAMRCLYYPLSANYEYKLVQSDNFEMIKDYICNHVLRESGEAQLAISASDKENPERAKKYRELLDLYFKLYYCVDGYDIFNSFMAKWCLFAGERNDKLIMQIIERCDMDDCVLESALIKRMAHKMDLKYLIWYLAHSYIADKDLITELLAENLPEHLRDMITISEQRRVIHEMVTNSLLLISDDWRNEEYVAFQRFNHENDEQARMAELKEFLKPRFTEGVISPAMSAWVAASCPELVKDVQLNLARYERHILNKIIFVNPLDLNAKIY